MEFDITCDCGNSAHDAEARFRKGYVSIAHPNGRVEERWDYLYLDTLQQKTELAEFAMVEFMFTPETARSLLWFLIKGYLPGFCRFYRAWRRWKFWWETWWYKHGMRNEKK